MESSTRHLEPERGQLGRRRGHVPQISISDDSHHVTEAIGDMYGDTEWNKRDSRPLSFAPSPPPEENYEKRKSYFESTSPNPSNESRLSRSISTEKPLDRSNGSKHEGRNRQSSLGSSHGGSPPPVLSRSNSSDTASQPFPLNDIDYESSPAAVAQELSNLQAIRRMSMNVDTADPDLPAFGSSFSVPTSPSGSESEDDTSKMFWVPARLHPELAPKEFRTFVEEGVERIRRRDSDKNLSPKSSSASRSSSSLNRRKSMLSKTIDSPIGYHDGADVLERKRSSRSSQIGEEQNETTLQELEALVNDPSDLVSKISMDSTRRSLESTSEVPAEEDMPILPPKPAGQSLKRSTRTNYRRGSLKKGERVPFSRRVAQRMKGDSSKDEDTPPSSSRSNEEDTHHLARTQTEPVATADNFSRPSRKGASGHLQSSASLEDMQHQAPSRKSDEPEDTPRPQRTFHSRIASNGRTTAQVPGYVPPPNVPQIIETPPPEPRQYFPSPQYNLIQNIPERKSSHEYSRQSAMMHRAQERQSTRPGSSRKQSPNQTLDDMANSPSMMPGTSTRTDALSFIPTIAEEKKSDKKSRDRKESADPPSSRKTSWGWLLGNQSQDQEREEKKEKKEKEEKESKKTKSKQKQPMDKAHDNTRLDVLHTASEGQRGRESLVYDRDSVRLEEERKKESSRKSGGENSKKDTGIFSALFGGGKKKGDRDSGSKKSEKDHRLSPEPPPRVLRPDIDYNWTRFSIMEERAIYRMAHLKLANPRRALYSQVLLSNFMYSYLAKVQQMQIPQYAPQSQVEQEPEEEPEPDEFSQWQRYQEEQERMAATSVNGPINTAPEGSGFIDDYDPGHQSQEDARYQRQQEYLENHHHVNGNGVYEQQQEWDDRDVYSQRGLFDDVRPPEDGDLW